MGTVDARQGESGAETYVLNVASAVQWAILKEDSLQGWGATFWEEGGLCSLRPHIWLTSFQSLTHAVLITETAISLLETPNQFPLPLQVLRLLQGSPQEPAPPWTFPENPTPQWPFGFWIPPPLPSHCRVSPLVLYCCVLSPRSFHWVGVLGRRGGAVYVFSFSLAKSLTS